MATPLPHYRESIQPILHRLPQASALIGRQGELQKALSSRQPGAPIYVHGEDGIGKTTFAIALAHELEETFSGAQLYYDFRSAACHILPGTPGEVMRDVILTLQPTFGAPEEMDLPDEYLQSIEETGSVLIVLDNVTSTEQVEALAVPEDCQLIVVSTKSLEAEDGCTIALAPLQTSDASTLLATSLPEAEKKAALDLCAGSPLALKLWGGTLIKATGDSPTPVSASVVVQQAILTSGFSPVHSIIGACIDLLPGELRHFCTLLGLFPADFDARAVQAILPQEGLGATTLLESLTARGLLDQGEAERERGGRYQMHEAVRAVCQARLSAEQQASFHVAHAKHLIQLAKEMASIAAQQHFWDALAIFARERLHFDTAFAWLDPLPNEDASLDDEDEEDDGGDEEADATNAPVRSGIDSKNVVSPEVRAALMVELVDSLPMELVGSWYFVLERLFTWLLTQRECAELIENDLGAAGANLLIGRSYLRMGQTIPATGYLRQALPVFKEQGDRERTVRTLGNLGFALLAGNMGDEYVESAVQCLEEKLVMSREDGDKKAMLEDLGQLAKALQTLGRDERAEELSREREALSAELA